MVKRMKSLAGKKTAQAYAKVFRKSGLRAVVTKKKGGRYAVYTYLKNK